MEPRVHVITLGVDDLDRALAFYRDGLGFESAGIIGTQWTDEESGANGAIALFELAGGLILSLYPRRDLAKDAGIPTGASQSGEFSLGQLVQSRADVDELLRQAEAAGAAVTPARERPWGIYSGYFSDPDGHLWEIIWNPGRVPAAQAAPDRPAAAD
jgi:catechol 2,3-dioxygenase-like lactoylglutathione lyase family enzyme